jgi:hypothetical protein
MQELPPPPPPVTAVTVTVTVVTLTVTVTVQRFEKDTSFSCRVPASREFLGPLLRLAHPKRPTFLALPT